MDIQDIRSTHRLRTGRLIPVMGLGTWQLTEDTSGTIEMAMTLGYPMLDTANDYNTQSGIAIGLKQAGVKRDEVFMVTKVEENEDAFTAARRNVEELQLDYVDLILIHRPPQNGVGEKLWEGLIRAREEGITKDIGVSNYSVEQIRELVDITGETPVVNQIEWSPFGHDLRMLEFANENGVIIQAYSPLTRATRLDDETLNQIAKQYTRSPAQILLRWNLQLGTVPIPKAGQISHLKENIDIFNFTLSKDDMERLSNLNEHYSALESLQYV